MLKATAEGPKGRLIILGLSYRNLDKLRQDNPIPISGKELGIDADILIFSDVNETLMATQLERFIDSRTRVHIDPKLKS